VTRTVATSLVSVKQIGEDCHSHTIEESFIAKRPKFLLGIAKAEKKNMQHKSIMQCAVLG